MRGITPEIVREILRLRDVEKLSVREIAEGIKHKYGIELKNEIVWTCYRAAKCVMIDPEADPELIRKVLKVYKEGKDPVDAVIEVDGVTPEFAEILYIWFMEQKKHQAVCLKITEELIKKILNTETEGGVSLREIFEKYDEMLKVMKKLVQKIEELGKDVEDSASAVRNLSFSLSGEVEKLGNVVYDAEGILKGFREIPERLNEKFDEVKRLLKEILENQRKGFFRRLVGK